MTKFWQIPTAPWEMPTPSSSKAVQKFALGRLVATPNALAQVPSDELLAALARHASGDWGDVCPEDWQANEQALSEGFRLLSAYHTKTGTKFWIISEADRSATTALMPEDY